MQLIRAMDYMNNKIGYMKRLCNKKMNNDKLTDTTSLHIGFHQRTIFECGKLSDGHCH